MQNGQTYTFTPKKNSPPPDLRILKRIAAVAAVLLAILLVAGTCWYTVDEKQQAVITTFGKVTGTAGAGMHFKLPFGIQNVEKVNLNVYQKLEIGYRTDADSPSYDEVITKESKMITGDYNIVNVDFFVEYRFSDPVKAIYASQEPVAILKNISMSCIRNVIGSYPVDDVLTTGKNEIQAAIKAVILEKLEAQDLGIQLVNITIQDSEPPTTEVMEAFKAVETAKQGKETSLNNANKYRNEQLPQAQAEADAIIKDAEAQKAQRINEATAQVARFNAMYEEYIKNPEITKQRMFYEAMEEVLPSLKVIIESGSGNVQTIYPVESFSTTITGTNN